MSVRDPSRPGHNHFHLARFERYELRNAANGAVARDTKAGFCLGDRAPVGTAHGPARFTGPCGRGIRDALRLTVGISVGWADPYSAELDGQELDLTGLPAGICTLLNRVNGDGTLRESSYGDNGGDAHQTGLAERPLRAPGRHPTRLLPRGTVPVGYALQTEKPRAVSSAGQSACFTRRRSQV